MHKIIITTEEHLSQIVETAVGNAIKNISRKPEISEFGGLELAMEITGLCKPTLYSMTSLNQIPHMKISSKLRFNRTDLLKWMAEKNQGLK